MMQEATADTKNRAHSDRRNTGWRTVLFGFARSRRRQERRVDAVEPIFSDWHHPWLFFLAVGTMLLSCVDAFLTLLLLENGAYEANPVMASAMGASTLAFTSSKMLMTGLGILALVFLSRSRFMNQIRTGIFLTGVFSIYACLICYELVFLMSLH